MGVRGPRKGSGGRPKKPLKEKLIEGNLSKRPIKVSKSFSELEGEEMPEPSEMLSETQKDGSVLQAKEIYQATWKWLDARKCATIISPQLLERYAMSAARWIHCENIITKTGYLAKHPTTNAAIASPYVTMSQNYMTQTNRLWMEIYEIVKSNTETDYNNLNPQDDLMERLLRARENK